MTLIPAVSVALAPVLAISTLEETHLTNPGCPFSRTVIQIKALSVINQNEAVESVADLLEFTARTSSVGTTNARGSLAFKENCAPLHTVKQKGKLGKKTGERVTSFSSSPFENQSNSYIREISSQKLKHSTN